MAIKKTHTRSGAVRYEVVLDIGADPQTGKRRQIRRRYPTLREARAAEAEYAHDASRGTFVARRALTFSEVAEEFLNSRHHWKSTTESRARYQVGVANEFLGAKNVQALTKSDIDRMVVTLRKGGTTTPTGRPRKAWGATSINALVGVVRHILADAQSQGLVPRNVAETIKGLPSSRSRVDSFTAEEVEQFLDHTQHDRLHHVWLLALCGLRRGEIAALRWADIDFDAGTLTAQRNRVLAGSAVVEHSTKTRTSTRTLPMPVRLSDALRRAYDETHAGDDSGRCACDSGACYVAQNEIGHAYRPNVLSRYWPKALDAAGMRHIRLHDARHTCATLMHLDGVPIAVIAQWLGHSSPTMTLKLYAHSQDHALTAAASSLFKS